MTNEKLAFSLVEIDDSAFYRAAGFDPPGVVIDVLVSDEIETTTEAE